MSTPLFEAITVPPSAQALALASLAHSAQWSDHPPEVVAHTLKIVRDTFGVMLGGSTLAEVKKFAANWPKFYLNQFLSQRFF